MGHIRGKFGSIPIPGETVTLNGPDLINQAKEEQNQLREELKTILDEMTYGKLMEGDAQLVSNVSSIQEKIPLSIFVG